MKIILSAESTVDLSKLLQKEFDVHIIPFTVVIGEEEKKDGDVKGEDLFAYTEKTGKLAHTSAINVGQYLDYFTDLLKDADAIIHFSLSSKITSATGNAITAAKEVEEKTGKRVIVIDSLSLSTGIAIQVLYCRKLIDKGLPIDEIVSKVLERRPYAQASFALERVDYLYKGGRCSAAAKFFAGALGIKPQILVKDGAMVSGKKFMGKAARWVPAYIDATLKQFDNWDPEICFLTYTAIPEEVLQAAEKKLYEIGFKRVERTIAGATISCHCGPGTLGILYYNDGPHPLD